MDDKATMIDRNQLARLKRTNLWITDVAVLSSCNVLVISTTSRELNFYDVSSNVYKCLYRLCGKYGIFIKYYYNYCLTRYPSCSIMSDKLY